MRTLVISDLHLGSRHERDVLRREAPLRALEDALTHVDRLVLLGDLLELLEGRVDGSLTEAEPVLKRLAAAMPGGEILMVPGNHDHLLVRAWVRQRRAEEREIGAATRVPQDATPLLAEVCELLRPPDGGRVRVQYPGAWLGRSVYAHHGHYLDYRLASAGPLGRINRAATAGALGPVDRYELSRSPTTAAASLVVRDLPDSVEESLDRVGGIARAFGKALVASRDPTGERTGRLAPVSAELLDRRLTKSGLAALVEVVDDLGALPRARHVLFGHVHRQGPLAGDDPAVWRPVAGGPQLWNSGSWVHEPFLAGRTATQSPYWPGGALFLDGEHATPQVLRLLDGIAPERVLPPPPPPGEGTALAR